MTKATNRLCSLDTILAILILPILMILVLLA